MKARRIAVMSVALSVAACGSAQPAKAPAKPTGPFYGAVTETPLTGSDFARMHDAGVKVLRFQLYWPTVQPSPRGPFVWDKVDKIVAGAAANGVRPLPILFGTPGYETKCGTHDCLIRLPIATARQRSDWQAFVAAAVARYGPGGSFWTNHPGLPIERWQAWNEQNNFNSKGRPRSTPAQYARLVRITRKALIAADPAARLMLGGMFGTPNGSTNPNITSWGFLSGLYKAGLKGEFDYVALHPYSPTISGIAYQVKRIRKVMVHHHDGGTPIVISELGWGSGKRNVSHPFVSTPKGQKRFLERSFRLLTTHRRRWNVAGVYWFAWKDPKHAPDGLCGFCYSAGLYKKDGTTPKPALHAFKQFAR